MPAMDKGMQTHTMATPVPASRETPTLKSIPFVLRKLPEELPSGL